MTQFASASIDLLARDRTTRVLKRLHNVLEVTKRKMEVVARAARLMLFAGAAGIAAILKIASDMEETTGKFEAVFKEQAIAAKAWVVEQARILQRSEKDLANYMATLQDTFVPFGFARDKAMELSKQLTLLGVDLASMNNMADDEAIGLLTSALVGNHEAVRRFGVMITAVTLDQALFNQGIAKGSKGATEQEKVLARLSLMFGSTADAQGDAIRTASGFANQMRGLAADAETAAVALGQHFLPIAKDWITSIRELLPKMTAWIKGNGEAIITTIKWTAALGVASLVLPKVIGFLQGLNSMLLLTTTALKGVTIEILAAKAAASLGVSAIIAALIALSAAIWVSVKARMTGNAALQEFLDLTVTGAKAYEALRAASDRLNSVVEDENRSLGEQKVALETVISTMRVFIETLKEDIGVVENAASDLADYQADLKVYEAALVALTRQIKDRGDAEAEVAAISRDTAKAVQKLVDKLKHEADTLGMTAVQAGIAKIGIENFSAAQLESIRASVAAKEAYTEEMGAMEKLQKSQEIATVKIEKFNDMTNRLVLQIGQLTGSTGQEALRMFDLENMGLASDEVKKVIELERILAGLTRQKNEDEERARQRARQDQVQGRIEGLKALFVRIQTAATTGPVQNRMLAVAAQTAISTQAGFTVAQQGFRGMLAELRNILNVLITIQNQATIPVYGP